MCSLVFFFAAHVAEMGEIGYDEPTKATPPFLNYTSLPQLSLTIVISLVLACLAMTCLSTSFSSSLRF